MPYRERAPRAVRVGISPPRRWHRPCWINLREMHMKRSGIVIKVWEHGAKGDGTTDDTHAIRHCLKKLAEHKDESVTLVLGPYGEVSAPRYLCGPLKIHTHFKDLTIEILTGATLLAYPARWGKDNASADNTSPPTTPFVLVMNCDNFTLRGGGVIDGAGAAWWRPTSPAAAGPMTSDGGPAQTVMIDGAPAGCVQDITVRNPAHVALHLQSCGDASKDAPTFVLERLTLQADIGTEKPETLAGIVISASHQILVRKIRLIDMTDDNLVLKSDCSHVTCQNVMIQGPWWIHGFGPAIGTEIGKTTHDIVFDKIYVSNVEGAIHLKPTLGQSATLKKTTFSDIEVHDVDNAIIIEGVPDSSGNVDIAVDDINAAGGVKGKKIHMEATFKSIHGKVADRGNAYNIDFCKVTKDTVKGHFQLEDIDLACSGSWGSSGPAKYPTPPDSVELRFNETGKVDPGKPKPQGSCS